MYAARSLSSCVISNAFPFSQRGMPYEYSCLRVMTETAIADILLNHPDGLHIDEIAKQVNLESGKLSRIMRLLATRSCFVEGTERLN